MGVAVASTHGQITQRRLCKLEELVKISRIFVEDLLAPMSAVGGNLDAGAW